MLFSVENLVSLVSLVALEIVLGIDNIVVLAILAQRVERARQNQVRRLGLALALVLRLGLLFTLSTIMKLTAPLFQVLGHAVSGRDLVLLGGGLFLIGKATHEIHGTMEGGSGDEPATREGTSSFGAVLVQILALDVVFSLDSVITAVGMAAQIWVMVVAMVIAVAVMMLAAGGVSAFITRHPTMRMLALSFLLLVGVLLVAEGVGKHIEKGYIYFAMGFSFLVEVLNIRMRKKAPVKAPSSPAGPTP
jgi:predicted tellurium resistance membrane protein TerC